MTEGLLTRVIEERRQLSTRSNRENTLTSLSFPCVLALFLIATAINFSIKACSPVGSENRPASAFPHLQLSRQALTRFPGGFESFFNDRFAIRSNLVYALALLRFKAFDLTDKDRVLVGKDGWLFYRDGGDEETLRNWPMIDSELVSWAKMLDERRSWCQRHGIKFFYAIAPTKSTIYREFVPEQYTRLNEKSRADQLKDYLLSHTKVEVIDMRPAVKAQKARGLVFFKTDTHWNKFGAYFGYRACIDAIKQKFPVVKPLQLSDMQKIPNQPKYCDLPDYVGLHGAVLDSFDDYLPREGQGWRVSKEPSPPADILDQTTRFTPFATESDKSASVKAFFIRDSFWIFAQPYFSETFRRAYFNWDGAYAFPTARILKEKPDFVVMEMVERFLARPVPLNPPDIN